MTRRAAVTVAVMVLLAGIVPPAIGTVLPPIGLPITPPSATRPTALGTLDGTHPLLRFSGAAGNTTPLPMVNSPVPVICAVGCQEFTFAATGRDPFLVSVRDTTQSPNDGFDLYVYDAAGHLAGAGNGVGADGEALKVKPAAPGRYTIAVTFTYVDNQNARYDGEVRLMTGPYWKPPPPTCGPGGCLLLPELRAAPAKDLHVDGLPPVASTPLGFPLPVSTPTQTSCYADETIGVENPSVGSLQKPVTRCLRFTTDVQNVGAGPLDVRLPWLDTSSGQPRSGFVQGQCQAVQAVSTTTGGVVTRPAGACEFHPAHGHFHYKDLVSFALFHNGVPVGAAIKQSFCLGDDDYFGFGTAGPNGPRDYVGQPGCNLPAQLRPAVTVEEGISPGWGDVYTWDTPDQFIDVTHLPAGTYDLVERTNPSGHLLVSGPSQTTCAMTRLTLTATSVHQVPVTPAQAVSCT